MTQNGSSKKTENGSISVDGATIDYQVRRSRRREKTIQIALDPHEGVVVSVPFKAKAQDIADVVRKRARWILHRVNSAVQQPAPVQFVSGESLPYLGGQVALRVEALPTKQIRVSFADLQLTVAVPSGLAGDERQAAIAWAIERWYRQRAVERLDERVRRWAPAIGREPKQVVVRDQHRRWGSCSADGVIRFNWRLIQLDPSLLDYVVVHELAHLLERNHAAAFWQVVARVLPDYQLRRRQFKEAGTNVVL